ncbi:MAG: hypothetical protein ACUVR4_10070 [Anaerolineae bacterium]
MIRLRRAAYRARQFFEAVAAYLTPLSVAERAEAHAHLPARAQPLFDAMPRQDQRHSLRVARMLQAAGHHDPALLQAALLHDAAKAQSGLTLFHRVAVVLLKAFWPAWLAAWRRRPAPPRQDARYPFWAHVHHPELGARLAERAGCLPEAVALIRLHQERADEREDPGLMGKLAALQAADDDN